MVKVFQPEDSSATMKSSEEINKENTQAIAEKKKKTQTQD